MEEKVIIAVLVLLIMFIIFRRRSSGMSGSSGERTYSVKKTLGGPVEQMTLNDINNWNQDPARATDGQRLEIYTDENQNFAYGTLAVLALRSFNVHMSPTSTVTKTAAEIIAWNQDPVRGTDGQSLNSWTESGQTVYGTADMIKAYYDGLAAAAAADEAAKWGDYPASDKTLYQYLNNMQQDVPMAIRTPPANLFSVYVLLDQLNDRSCLSNINSIITTMNIPYRKWNATSGSAPISLNLVPYTSDDQIKTMFDTAESATGEAGLSKTDKVILRILTSFSVDLFKLVITIHAANPTLLEKYAPTSDGKCPWSDAIFAQTGETVKTNIIHILNLVTKMNDNQGPATATSIKPLTDTINALLPAGMEPLDPTQYLQTMRAIMGTKNVTSTPQIQSFIWFIKYITAGPLYIWWLAKNKWNLSTDFNILA